MARGTSPQPPPKSHLSRTNPPTSSAASKPIPHPIPHPTTLLTSSFARTYTHLHPILILTLFTARFSATVRDPIHSLTTLLIPLALLQFTYCILCIPASDTPTPRKRSKGLATLKRRAFPALLSIVLALLLPPLPIAALLVLHGAPLTTHHAETGLLAVHVALLATPTLFYAHGIAAARWRALLGLVAPLDVLTGAAVGTLVGCWAGAVPIPLDWDREWQRWPVTVVSGAYMGWAVGGVLGGWVFKGRRVQFD